MDKRRPMWRPWVIHRFSVAHENGSTRLVVVIEFHRFDEKGREERSQEYRIVVPDNQQGGKAIETAKSLAAELLSRVSAGSEIWL